MGGKFSVILLEKKLLSLSNLRLFRYIFSEQNMYFLIINFLCRRAKQILSQGNMPKLKATNYKRHF